MKCDILLDILFDLLSKRKVTAPWLAERYEMSTRSVYRYVDVLSLSVPVQVKSGRNGGIYISDAYKLPVNFMTEEEYDACQDALSLAYGQLSEDRFVQAQRKLSAQSKTERRELALSGNVGSIVVDGGTWGDSKSFSEKIRIFENCVRECLVTEIEYHGRLGEFSKRKIEPHVLVFKQGVWYVYAFCRKRREFRLFRLGRIFSVIVTEEKFNKKPLTRDDVPLAYWTNEQSERVEFEISEKGFADALDWLGYESLRKDKDGWWRAEVSLPFDDELVKKVLSFGKEIKVLAPEPLKERVRKKAKEILGVYE